MNNKLIYDGDVLRNCDSNKAQLGFFKSYYYFYGYKKLFKSLFSSKGCIKEFLYTMGCLIIYIAILPIYPFVECYVEVNKAKKRVRTETYIIRNKKEPKH